MPAKHAGDVGAMTDRAVSITAAFRADPGAIEALARAAPPQKLTITVPDGHPTLPPGVYAVEPDPDAAPVEVDGKLEITMRIVVRQCIACGAIMGRPTPDCLVCQTVGLGVRRHKPIE